MTADGWLGDYRLDGLLGRGGMGEVHRAVDTRRSRAVALKVLRDDVARDPGFRERFRREAGATAGLQSPHIVPIHDFGEIDGRLFIDMRLVHGTGLDTALAHGPLPVHRAVAIVGQVADGLAHAHEHGILHRDVKPSNILLTPADFVYLVDFGIAHRTDGSDPGLTATGMTIGTWAYLAPERFDAGPVDERSDVYSLACVLAECLLGRRPFDGTGPASLMKAHLVAEPPRPSRERPDVPAALDDVIARGMAKDPAQRFGSARELAAAAVTAISGPAPTRARPAAGASGLPPTTVDAAPVRRRRSRTPVLAGTAIAALVLAVGVGIGIGRMSGADATQEPAPGTEAPRTSTAAPVAPAAPAAATDRPTTYVLSVDSNYPVFVNYIDAAGDQVSLQNQTAPWSVTVDTSRWGADAKPLLSAASSSTKGDTVVSCSITDEAGRVLAGDSTESAFAGVSCALF